MVYLKVPTDVAKNFVDTHLAITESICNEKKFRIFGLSIILRNHEKTLEIMHCLQSQNTSISSMVQSELIVK